MLKTKVKEKSLKAVREKTIYHLLQNPSNTNYYSENNREVGKMLSLNTYDVL